jgi:elongation factor Tu
VSTDPSFRMTIEDTFTIRNRGTVVTGKIEQGKLKVGDEVHLKHQDTLKKTVVSGIESLRKQTTEAQAGETVGILFKDISKDDAHRGDVLTGSDSDFSWNF